VRGATLLRQAVSGQKKRENEKSMFPNLIALGFEMKHYSPPLFNAFFVFCYFQFFSEGASKTDTGSIENGAIIELRIWIVFGSMRVTRSLQK
jgi:hypothetical protein